MPFERHSDTWRVVEALINEELAIARSSLEDEQCTEDEAKMHRGAIRAFKALLAAPQRIPPGDQA